MTLTRTPSQTVGPFYTIGLCRRPEHELAEDGIELTGQLLDGQGEPIRDGVIELWDPAGGRWGRSGTDSEGHYSFLVTKPAALPGQAPRFDLFVFARGLLQHQLTRIYFPGEPNDEDPVFSSLGHAETLVAQQEDDALRFDIRMQGDRATIFFAQ